MMILEFLFPLLLLLLLGFHSKLCLHAKFPNASLGCSRQIRRIRERINWRWLSIVVVKIGVDVVPTVNIIRVLGLLRIRFGSLAGSTKINGRNVLR